MATAWRSTRAKWLIVLALVAAYAVSFLDRQVVALLVGPLKHDLGLTDTQIGVLQGPAFGVFYALFGLPLGWLADHVHRIRLIVAAIALWSLMTAAAGFATGFWWLLACRCGVGIGEAALVPAGVSLISDLFRPTERAMPLSVFTSGLAAGAGLSLVLGGALIAMAEMPVPAFDLLFAVLPGTQAWRLVFVLTGLIGLPIAALMLLFSEPPRSADMVATRSSGSLAATLGYLRQQRSIFLPLLAATTCLYVVSNAMGAWYPTLFFRRFDWPMTQVGHTLGLLIIASAMIGNLSSGTLATWRERRNMPNATVATMATGALIVLPASVVTPLLPTAVLTLAGAGVYYFGIALTFGVATAALAALSPGAIRGQVVAIYLLLGNLLGLGLGPMAVGLLLDHGGPLLGQIGPSLALTSAVVALPAAFMLRRVARLPAIRERGRHALPVAEPGL